jgi:hypothetical protein
VNPVNGTLKRNESRYVPGNRLHAKQIITTKILPEKHKFRTLRSYSITTERIIPTRAQSIAYFVRPADTTQYFLQNKGRVIYLRR